MPIATPVKPRILCVGSTSFNPSKDAELRTVAEVFHVPGKNGDILAELVDQAVRENGPFKVFAGFHTPGERYTRKWDQATLGALAPECKLYIGPGAGYDKVDVNWMTQIGACYANTPIAVGQRTADGAMALILAAMKGVTQQDSSARAGQWVDRTVRSIDWRTSTIGIIGLGNIGHHVADMCSCLGMKVVYHSRRPRTDCTCHSPNGPGPSTTGGRACRYEWLSSDDLYKRSDVIVLTCPLTEETRHLINSEALAKMKDGVVLVNVARGPVVDEEALVAALESGKVMRAALDVFENEPLIHPKLQANSNVTLSPHWACGPDSMAPPINSEMVDSVIHFLHHGSPLSPINEDELRRMGHLGEGRVNGH